MEGNIFVVLQNSEIVCFILSILAFQIRALATRSCIQKYIRHTSMKDASIFELAHSPTK